MSIAKKIAHEAEAVNGGAKKIVGRVIGSRRLHRPKAAVTRPRATLNRPARRSRTPSSADHSAPSTRLHDRRRESMLGLSFSLETEAVTMIVLGEPSC